MQSVSKRELQADMERLFQKVEESGEPLIVTEADRPVLIVRPIARPPSHGLTAEEAFADLRGKVVFYEDPTAPTTDEWEALNDDDWGSWSEGFSC